ncbi:MAG TPA: hypothetical protein VNL36_06125 [Bacteroidota bacterium]|nr:hypothetical protein [Bacteroidota bacterium]
MSDDVRLFSHENILKQLETAEYQNGYYVLEFYAEGNKPSSVPTDRVAKFYLYPSAGTLRDSNFQLLFYDSKYDTYRGFQPPHMRNNKSSGTG